ncbi:MAG TPA: MMPL family transporter [Balneolales bacterium]|nr:MMPL family transporter [Balneolales bacterium]
MEKILKLFKPLFKKNYSHPYYVLSISIILAVFTGYFALHLKIDTDIANLLPKNFETVKALNNLKNKFGGESYMELAIKSPSFKDNKRFAEDFIPKALKLYDPHFHEKYFKDVEFKKNTKILKDNALYLATNQELYDIQDYLQKEIKKAKLKANPFYFNLTSDSGSSNDDSLKKANLQKFMDAYNEIIPKKYPINADSTVMVLKFYPTGSKSNTQYLQDMYASTDSLIHAMHPTQYNPKMIVKAGGRLKRHLIELDSIMNDVKNSFASGITSVLLLVMLYFFFKKYYNYRKGADSEQKHGILSHIWRAPVPLIVIGLPLLISLSYTFGIAYFTLGKLNTMTSVLFVILFGMGIDYGIHFYARYLEIRSAGKGVYAALVSTYENTGSAIITSAFTTAIALYVLTFAQFKGFSQFGFISGNGILLSLLCTLFILPAILVVLERNNLILINTNEKDGLIKTAPHRYPFARTILVIGLLVSAVVIIAHNDIKFQYDFGKLEPEFPKYEAFDKMISGVFHSTKRNPAYVIANSDQQVMDILKAVRKKMKEDTLSPTIADVEAIQERFPMNHQAQQAKLKKIAQIRKLLNDPFIKNKKDKDLDKLRRAAQTRKPLKISQIPNYLKNRFMTKNGKIGRFVIIYPSVGLSNGKNSIAFKKDIGKITTDKGQTFYAASTSLVAANMLQLMMSESPYMVIATFIMIIILMYVAFRSVRWTLIAMLPLVVGLLWTFGIMMVFGMSLNFYNLVVLPAILGIGEDSGVHLAARYREEGKNSMWDVLSSTGQHISMGSLTTMLGFSGLLFTMHPGLISIGELATIGIGMTLLSAIVFLPALVQWLEDKDWIRFD